MHYKRWIWKIIYGKRRATQFWQLSTDPETLLAMRLVLQPLVFFNLLQPWLAVFSIPSLLAGFTCLLMLMDGLPGAIFSSPRDASTPISSG